MQQRISDWIKQFNIVVVPCEERPDKPAGEVVYRLKDLFTTCEGSWDPSHDMGSLPQWARDAYLRPPSADDYFDDAGGAQHLFARVLDLEGKPVKTPDLDHRLVGWLPPARSAQLCPVHHHDHDAQGEVRLGQPADLEQVLPRRRPARGVVLVPARGQRRGLGRRSAQRAPHLHLRRLAGRTARRERRQWWRHDRPGSGSHAPGHVAGPRPGLPRRDGLCPLCPSTQPGRGAHRRVCGWRRRLQGFAGGIVFTADGNEQSMQHAAW